MSDYKITALYGYRVLEPRLVVTVTTVEVPWYQRILWAVPRLIGGALFVGLAGMAFYANPAIFLAAAIPGFVIGLISFVVNR